MSFDAWEASHKEYLADPRLSRSAVECFIESPIDYFEQYEAGITAQQESKEQRLGTLLHGVVLHPDFFTGSCVRIPPQVLSASGARSGAAWKAWKADQNPDHLLLMPPEYDNVQRILQRVASHPVLGELLRAEGEYERNIAFTQAVMLPGKTHHVDCKARLDKIIYPTRTRGPLILDLKSTSKPISRRSLEWQAESYAWHRQGAWYSDAAQRQFEFGRPCPVVFGVVQTVRPYEAAAVMPDEDWYLEGWNEMSLALEDICRRRDSGDWGRPDADRVAILSRPRRRGSDDL